MPQPIRSTTQQSLDIEDITNNLILLKDGGAAIVIKVSAINFNLLSEEEQDAIIYSYASLLNSLSFPIQILIRSQKKDVSSYVKLIQAQEARELNPVYKARLSDYREFIEQIVKERNVLDKKFYVTIPFFRTELGLTKSTANSLIPNAKTNTDLPFDKIYIIQKALNTLEPKRDHLLRQFTHLNLSARQLTTQELIQLMYTAYNPDTYQGVMLDTPTNYQSPIVATKMQKTQTPSVAANLANPEPNLKTLSPALASPHAASPSVEVMQTVPASGSPSS